MAEIEKIRIGDTLHVPVTVKEIQDGFVKTSVSNQTLLWLTEEVVEKCKHVPNENYFRRYDRVRLRDSVIKKLLEGGSNQDIENYYNNGIIIKILTDGFVLVNWHGNWTNSQERASDLEITNGI